MSFNKYRKCAKCGKTRAEDESVSYHRFPNPGTTNIIKARAWAKYCWPNQEWTTVEQLLSLYTSNKVLCGRHFNTSQFYDNNRQKLSKFAVPDSPEVEKLLNAERENVFKKNTDDTNTSGQLMLRKPLMAVDNMQTQPSTSTDSHLLCSEPSTKQCNDQLCSSKEAVSRMPFIQAETCQTSSIQAGASKIAAKPKFNKHQNILKAVKISQHNEMNPREIKLYDICKKHIKEVARLRKQLKNKKNIIMHIAENENVKKLCNAKLSNSFMIILQNQLKNCRRRPKGRRYTLNDKIMSLIIYKKSPACYRLLRRIGLVLPSQSSLNKLLNRVPLRPGINSHIFKSLKKFSCEQTDEQNICILSFDEMSVRKHLTYNSKLDQIQGFEDHDNHGRSNKIASKALVFMLAGLVKKWKQPIAFYFTHSLNSDRLAVIVKEMLTECFNSNMNVVATVCDLSTVNIKTLKILGATSSEPFFMHCGHEIVTILDPPHLLKCSRNLLMKHDVKCETDLHYNDTTATGIVKWTYIAEFYKLDKNNPNFVYAPALTDSHLNPNIKEQMRVSLAAQVFSHSVASGILSKISSKELPSESYATAMFVQKFDDLFDAVNAGSVDLRRGKKYSANLTINYCPHIELFAQMRKFISKMQYLGSKSKPPSQEGWIHTLNGIEKLWKNLNKINIQSLSTRRLNQDPLENCFGCIRYSCGSNTNPTIAQFVAGIKTAIISNLKHSGQKRNCEDDTLMLSNNLSDFLITDIESSSSNNDYDDNQLEIDLTDAAEAVEQATPEGQACGYVCGFIFRKSIYKKCVNCKNAFLAETPEAIHIFTSFREYDHVNHALAYVNINVIKCVESCATIINKYLKTNAHKYNIRTNIFLELEKNIDFGFLNTCMSHLSYNIKHIKTCSFFICIKRYTIIRNREFDEEEKRKGLQRKIKILQNK